MIDCNIAVAFYAQVLVFRSFNLLVLVSDRWCEGNGVSALQSWDDETLTDECYLVLEGACWGVRRHFIASLSFHAQLHVLAWKNGTSSYMIFRLSKTWPCMRISECGKRVCVCVSEQEDEGGGFTDRASLAGISPGQDSQTGPWPLCGELVLKGSSFNSPVRDVGFSPLICDTD